MAKNRLDMRTTNYREYLQDFEEVRAAIRGAVRLARLSQWTSQQFRVEVIEAWGTAINEQDERAIKDLYTDEPEASEA